MDKLLKRYRKKRERKSRSFGDTSSPVTLDETHFSNVGLDFAHNYFDGSYVMFVDSGSIFQAQTNTLSCYALQKKI